MDGGTTPSLVSLCSMYHVPSSPFPKSNRQEESTKSERGRMGWGQGEGEGEGKGKGDRYHSSEDNCP